MNPLTVLIIDDNPVFMEALTAYLEGCPRIGAITRSDTGEAALAAVAEQRPDLVLLDVFFRPDSDGLDLLRLIKSRPRPPRVVLMSMLDLNAEAGGDPHIAAADGHLAKQRIVAELPALLEALFGKNGD